MQGFSSLPFFKWLSRRREQAPAQFEFRELQWETLPPGPSPRLDAGSLQIGSLLYCIGGYVTQDEVLSVIDVFDLQSCQWTQQIPMPVNMPNSHLAIACEAGRYIYSVAGQLGPRCCAAVGSGFVFDVTDQSWRELPTLPEPRYAPTMQFWRGRLHIFGGALADRKSPASDHWSLGVNRGWATDDHWRLERAVPRGGGHRASVLLGDRLYAFGGQEGDFEPISNDPNCACSGETIEYVFPDCYRLDSPGDEWVRVADMPVQSSHTEFSLVVRDPLAIVVGGSHFKHPETFDITLTDVIQLFDMRSERWFIIGKIPFCLKTPLTAYYQGWLYATTGQKEFSETDPRPGAIENGVWRARLNL